MKVLLVSDSHGNNEALDELIAKWQDVDLYLHAGDSQSHPRSIYPFRVVRGNCDYSFDMQDELLIPSPFGNILMRHKDDLSQKELEEKNIKVFIYGHTHIPECAKRKDIAFINPGSIVNPRSEFGSTYMILDINQHLIDVKLYSLETHQMLKRYRVSLEKMIIEEKQIRDEEQDLSEIEKLERELDRIEKEVRDIKTRSKRKGTI